MKLQWRWRRGEETDEVNQDFRFIRNIREMNEDADNRPRSCSGKSNTELKNQEQSSRPFNTTGVRDGGFLHRLAVTGALVGTVDSGRKSTSFRLPGKATVIAFAFYIHPVIGKLAGRTCV